jgi:hypothetical protein
VTAAATAILLVALLAAAALLARRRGAAGPPPLLLLHRQPLGKESGVAVVRFGGEELLVGYGAAGVVPLTSLGPDEERA